MKFFERQDGITAKVARGGTTICVADVSRTKHPYHEFFPKVRSEIAVPLFDFVRGAPGGVINVEYTDEDSPKSGRMLETYTRLLEEVADTVGAAYSSFLMSVQSEAMHTLALKLPTLRTEDDLLQSVVQELSSLYLCPVVIWSPISQDDPSLLMPRAFTDELPESWGRHKSKPQLRLGTSPLHSILIDNDAVYVSDIEDKAVAHWRTYARLGLRSALVTPIADITGQRGMIEICTRTRCQFLPYEVRLLEQLAGQVGYELERIRLANESVERILRQPVTAVVHDIKGPIERIPVWIDMIEQNCQLETPSCHEILVALQEESSYLESIAGLMPIQLEFSLAGAIPTERFDVFALLEEAVNSMQKHRVIEKDQVKWHGKRDPVYVRGNRAIARGIFSNLVINAARAMREEQPKKQSLSIAIVKPEGSDSVFLRFANSSSRLPSQILERLVRFQPIFERNSSGGFGLATYAKLVSAMGGQLEFSQEPWGLVFQVVLPLSKEA
jgi:signal transduction histidine kinase